MANAFGFCNEMKMSGDDRGFDGSGVIFWRANWGAEEPSLDEMTRNAFQIWGDEPLLSSHRSS